MAEITDSTNKILEKWVTFVIKDNDIWQVISIIFFYKKLKVLEIKIVEMKRKIFKACIGYKAGAYADDIDVITKSGVNSVQKVKVSNMNAFVDS